MMEWRRWSRLIVVVGLPAFVATGLVAAVVQIGANRYVEQGFEHLALLLLRRLLNTSALLFVFAAVLALGAVRLPRWLTAARGGLSAGGGRPQGREPDEGAAPPRRSLDTGAAPAGDAGTGSRSGVGGDKGAPPHGPDVPGDRSGRAVEAALALLVLVSILAAHLFVEFLPSIHAAVRTSQVVDAIQEAVGPVGDFLGTRAGKLFLLISGAASCGAVLLFVAVRTLEHERPASALDGLLARARSRRGLVLAAASLAAVAGVNAAAWALRPEAGSGRPNIIMISLETVRADHLGVWGYARDTAPSLARLAERGVVYANAIAQAPWTLPSMASVHTGLYLSEHGAAGHKSKLGARFATLAEGLAEAGYATMAVVSWPFVTRAHGFDQGFAIFDQERIAEDGSEVLAPWVTRRAVEMIGDAGRAPFFLWLHYVEPHGAYVDHEGIDHASGYGGSLPRVIDLDHLYDVKESLREDDVRYVRDAYDEEITVMDRSIGRLLDALEEKGLAERTVVVVFGDHGEEFLEREHFGHARHLYQELIHVPLIIVDPSDPGLAGLRVEDPVELRAVAPTILSLAGTRAPTEGEARAPKGFPVEDEEIENGLAGGGHGSADGVFEAPVGSRSGRDVDLLDLARGSAAPRPAFSEYVDQWRIYGERKAVVEGPYKMIREPGGGAVELYDLASDPGERRNLLAPATDPGTEPARTGAPGRAIDPQGRNVKEPATQVSASSVAPGAVPGDSVPADLAVGEMAARLARALDSLSGSATPQGDEAVLSEEEIERLRTLGYVR